MPRLCLRLDMLNSSQVVICLGCFCESQMFAKWKGINNDSYEEVLYKEDCGRSKIPFIA